MGPDASAAESRRRLTDLRNGLLRLHKVALFSERAWYEREVARIHSAGEFLELALHDPWFAWLRELSELVVTIDEVLAAEEPATASDADGLVAKARALLTPAENGTGFGRRYFEALQRDPDVVLAHGHMMKVFARLAA